MCDLAVGGLQIRADEDCRVTFALTPSPSPGGRGEQEGSQLVVGGFLVFE